MEGMGAWKGHPTAGEGVGERIGVWKGWDASGGVEA